MPAELHSQYIFTTLRYDEALKTCDANTFEAEGSPSAIYLLTAHFDRLVRAARAVFQPDGQDVLIRAGLSAALCLELAIKQALVQEFGISEAGRQAYRVRFQLDAQALFPFDLIDDDDGPWRVVLDQRPTIKTIATQHKTSDRRDYDRARQDADISSFSETKEVLLYNDIGYIMDASITTPYFYRNDIWVTPRAYTGGQQGTTRERALEASICIESDVSISSLQAGEVIWLSNAARGFFSATYHALDEGATSD